MAALDPPDEPCAAVHWQVNFWQRWVDSVPINIVSHTALCLQHYDELLPTPDPLPAALQHASPSEAHFHHFPLLQVEDI